MTRVLITLPRLLRGRHAGHSDVTMMQFSRLEVETDEPLFFQLDGELREPRATRRMIVEVMPAALRVAGRPDATLDEVTR